MTAFPLYTVIREYDADRPGFARFNVTVTIAPGDSRRLLISGINASCGEDPFAPGQILTSVTWPAIGAVTPEEARHFALAIQTAAAWAEGERVRLEYQLEARSVFGEEEG